MELVETFQWITSFQGGRRCEGCCLIIFLIIISRTRVRSYYNGHKYMDFIFKVMVQQSITCRSLIYWIGGFTYLYQSKRFCTVQVTSQVVTKKMLVFLESLFDPMNDLDSEKKPFYLHMINESSVCRNSKKYLGLSILCCRVLFEKSIPSIMCLNGGNIFKK